MDRNPDQREATYGALGCAVVVLVLGLWSGALAWCAWGPAELAVRRSFLAGMLYVLAVRTVTLGCLWLLGLRRYCWNCGTVVKKHDCYCPHCGLEADEDDDPCAP